MVWASGFACKTGSQVLEGESACSAPNQGISKCFPRGLYTKVAHSVISRLYPELSLPWSLACWLLSLHPTQVPTECPELTSPEQQLYLSFHLWSLSFSPSWTWRKACKCDPGAPQRFKKQQAAKPIILFSEKSHVVCSPVHSLLTLSVAAAFWSWRIFFSNAS